MIVLRYDRKQEQVLLEAKEQVEQPLFFMEQLGRVSSGISAVNRRLTLVKLTEI